MAEDLRTGTTVWRLEDGAPLTHNKLEGNVATDICVVGGGVSGALLAYTLVEKGYGVVMLDEREISAGSTMASTAILSYETDVMLTDLIKNIGDEQAVRVFRAGDESLDAIEQITRDLSSDCNFKRRNSVYLASKKRDVKEIYQEYQTRVKYGFEVHYLKAPEITNLFSFQAPAALLTPGMGEIDPVKLTRALLAHAEKKGLEIYAQTHAKKQVYDPATKCSTVVADNGFAVGCRFVVYATGYETQQVLKQKKVKIISSYAIATEPVLDFKGWYERSTIWESARPYIYMRTTDDNRIVAGGEDEPFKDAKKRDALIAGKAKTLFDKIREKFPDIPFKPATAWAGTFAETNDGLPYIGAHSKYPGAYFALGYGGNGITFSAIASRIIPDLIAGRKNTDAEIFKFGR